MSETIATTTQEAPPPQATLRLMVPRAGASRDIQNSVKIGQAIRNQRVRDQRDLDEARREKQEWVQRTMELLTQLFNQGTVANLFNDWLGTILPEYAEFSMFVDQFNDEMRHRLGRLHTILKALSQVPEPQPIGEKSMPPPTESTAAAPVATTFPINPEFDAPPPLAPAAAKPAVIMGGGLFVMRAADNAARDAIAQFLNRFGLRLHLMDRTVQNARPFVEELDAQSSARFVLILTAAPEQHPHDADALFELGLCVGRLGAGRVILLHRGGDAGIDRFGINHVVIDNTDGWQLQLARHLRRGGVEVDLNKLV